MFLKYVSKILSTQDDNDNGWDGTGDDQVCINDHDDHDDERTQI